MFESQTLAASNAGMVVPGREGQGGQSSSKKQDPLLKGLKEIDSGMYWSCGNGEAPLIRTPEMRTPQ